VFGVGGLDQGAHDTVLTSLGREVHAVIRDCFAHLPPPKRGETTCDLAEYILMAPQTSSALLMN